MRIESCAACGGNGSNGLNNCRPCRGHGKICTIEDGDVHTLHHRYGDADIPTYIPSGQDRREFSMAMAAVCHHFNDHAGAERWLRNALEHIVIQSDTCICGDREWIVSAANHYGCVDLAIEICSSTFCPSYGSGRVVATLEAHPNAECASATPEFDRHRAYLYRQGTEFLCGFGSGRAFAEPITQLLKGCE